MISAERLVFAVLLFCAPAFAQGVEVRAHRLGTVQWEIDVEADQRNALECFSAIAAACDFELDVKSPEISAALATERLDLSLEKAPLEDLIANLAASCGYDGKTLGDEKRIVVSEIPDDDSDDTREYYRQKSLHALLVAFGDSTAPEDEVELLLRTARLQLEGREYSQAFDTFNTFLSEYKEHPEVPEATLGAVHAAYMAGRHEEVQRVAQWFIGKNPTDPASGRTQVIAARSRIATGDLGGGIALLKDLIRRVRDRELPQREGVIAEIMLAEARHRKGEDEDAIRGLLEAEVRYDRKHDDDVIQQIRFYMAICREATGNTRDALHDLEVAAFEIKDKKLRARTMLFNAQLLLRVDAPFLSLTSARVALMLEPEGRELFEVKRTMARALRRLRLEKEASDEMLAVILDAPKLIPSAEERRREVSATLREIGALYLEQGLFRDAIVSFQTIIAAAEHHKDELGPSSRELIAECRYLIATAEYRDGKWRNAIATLNAITEGVATEELARDIRRLKGDCYFASGMPEPAMRVWKEGEFR